jgi:hypothetical protein
MLRRQVAARTLFVTGFTTPWAYLGWNRPWHLRSRTTEEEARTHLPGDDLVPHPMMEATWALKISARPEGV